MIIDTPFKDLLGCCLISRPTRKTERASSRVNEEIERHYGEKAVSLRNNMVFSMFT